MAEEEITFTYRGDHERRLDKVVSDALKDHSRTRVQKLIDQGHVSVEGELIGKKSENVSPGSQVRVVLPPPEPTELTAENIPLEIVFENKDLLVVNKPAGMVVHPAPGHPSGTLVNAVLAHTPDIEGVGGVKRPGLVHRLDQDTSGVILLAKNDRAHHFLQEQFRTREVKKVYLALVDGKPPTPKGRVEVAVGRDPGHRKRMAPVVPQKGKEAVTEYYTRESFPRHTFLEIHPLTGRTHQIRVHMAFLECPVVGDQTYGRKSPSLAIDRHFLHASRLTITLPGDEGERTFQAPLPEKLTRILQNVREHMEDARP